jgi:1,4-dihydroxy-2-naphthoyl-CoA hydrolase
LNAAPIWHNAPTLDELNADRETTLAGHLDIWVTEIGPDFLRATMPVDARTHQPYGLLHGGASVALAETVGSLAATMCVDRTRFRCVGQEINANHLRPARIGRVTATARPIHRGGRSQVWGIEIVDAAGRLVCISRITIAVLDSGRTQ